MSTLQDDLDALEQEMLVEKSKEKLLMREALLFEESSFTSRRPLTNLKEVSRWLKKVEEINGTEDQPCMICRKLDRLDEGLEDEAELIAIGDEDKAFLCDSCGLPFHSYCLDSSDLPNGYPEHSYSEDWFCKNCSFFGLPDQRAIDSDDELGISKDLEASADFERQANTSVAALIRGARSATWKIKKKASLLRQDVIKTRKLKAELKEKIENVKDALALDEEALSLDEEPSPPPKKKSRNSQATDLTLARTLIRF